MLLFPEAQTAALGDSVDVARLHQCLDLMHRMQVHPLLFGPDDIEPVLKEAQACYKLISRPRELYIRKLAYLPMSREQFFADRQNVFDSAEKDTAVLTTNPNLLASLVNNEAHFRAAISGFGTTATTPTSSLAKLPSPPTPHHSQQPPKQKKKKKNNTTEKKK